MRTKLRAIVTVAIVLPFAAMSVRAEPVGTGFTYQGQLKQGGVPVNDTCDFQVGLWTADDVGTELGSQVVRAEVKNGLFTLRLNDADQLGANAFNGERRWLGISVSCPVDAPFVPLRLRQEVSAAPYALRAAGGEGGTGDGHSLDAADGDPVDAVFVANDGDVGLGTTGPTAHLEVRARADNDGGTIRARRGALPQWIEIKDNNASGGSITGHSSVTNKKNLLIQNVFGGGGTPAGPNDIVFRVGEETAPTEVMRLQSDGKVGIGTTEPTAALDIRSASPIITALNLANTTSDQRFLLQVNGADPGGSTPGVRVGSLELWGTGPLGNHQILRATPAGNLGIGTTSSSFSNGLFPVEDLHVFRPDSDVARIYATGSNPNSGAGMIFVGASPNVGGGIAYTGDDAPDIVGDQDRITFFNRNGNIDTEVFSYRWSGRDVGFKGQIGIGTNFPEARLHLADGSAWIGGTHSGLLPASVGAGIRIFNDSVRGISQIFAYDYGTSTPRDLVLNAPGGSVTVPVLQITGGADLSERFEVNTSGAKPEPGQVVCIDPDHPGRLAICGSAYDRTVAGVISGAGGVKPGMLMGQRGSVADGEHPVALTGRVYVWADASTGPIQPGDLLTTSDTPGHAMTVTDHSKAQGAILGKAMTSLSEGEGLVLLLVTLQ